jgi:hypothetical protein
MRTQSSFVRLVAAVVTLAATGASWAGGLTILSRTVTDNGDGDGFPTRGRRCRSRSRCRTRAAPR